MIILTNFQIPMVIEKIVTPLPTIPYRTEKEKVYISSDCHTTFINSNKFKKVILK